MLSIEGVLGWGFAHIFVLRSTTPRPPHMLPLGFDRIFAPNCPTEIQKEEIGTKNHDLRGLWGHDRKLATAAGGRGQQTQPQGGAGGAIENPRAGVAGLEENTF